MTNSTCALTGAARQDLTLKRKEHCTAYQSQVSQVRKIEALTSEEVR